MRQISGIKVGMLLRVTCDLPSSSFFLTDDIMRVSWVSLSAREIHGHLVAGPSFTGISDSEYTNYIRPGDFELFKGKLPIRPKLKAWSIK